MNHWVENFIEFVLAHNPGLIEGTVAVIMIAGLFLAFRSLRAPSGEAGVGAANLGDLEKTIQKLLEKASAVPATSAGSGAPAELITEIEVLKKNLAERQSEISALKSNQGAVPKGVSADEKAKLESQIRDLSNKLSEYEIISEDIADLSLYKDENTRLKKELDSMRTGAAAPPPLEVEIVAEPAAALPEVEVAPPAPTPAAPIAKPTPTPAPEAAAKSEPAPAEVVLNFADDDLMAEFAKAVEEQKIGGAPTPPAAQAQAQEPAINPELLKMQEEAEQMKEDVGVPEKTALEEELNTDRLQGEAEKLAGVDEPAMADFEKFVKKG